MESSLFATEQNHVYHSPYSHRCISDTHNDDSTDRVPSGDVFIHAGRLRNWKKHSNGSGSCRISLRLLSRVTITHIFVPRHEERESLTRFNHTGNHDQGLDPSHKDYSEKSHVLFTSSDVCANSLVYLSPEEPFIHHNDPLSIYANPAQPDFLGRGYGFTYTPYPAPDATAMWDSAPETSRGPLELWVAHGPPKGRLDNVGLFPLNMYLKGCKAQRRKIAVVKPLVSVFGHYHYSHGVEKVTWRDGANVKVGNEVRTSKMVA